MLVVFLLHGRMVTPPRTSTRDGSPALIGFCWATVTSSDSFYAIGPLSCLCVTLVYCGQTVGWINMPLGTEIGLGQRAKATLC